MGALESSAAGRRGGAVKAPRFWLKPRPTLLARLLQPAGWAYGRATARRMRGPGERAGAPTICVGNFVAGGAGKTPAALALARMLIGDGRRVAFLSRGYGGAERAEPLLVDPDAHTAAMVGDEPLLLAKTGALLGRGGSGEKRKKRDRSRRERAHSRRRPAKSGARQGPRPSPSWMARPASATASAFRLVRCARQFRRSCRSCRR